MTIRKRRQPTPGFGLPPPYQPITGERAKLIVQGLFPYCALVQVAAEDTHDDYVVCRGYDPRVKRYFDYEEGDADKEGFAVAKPYGNRTSGIYEIGQVFIALLPIGQLGQNPGVAADTEGHPADLDEDVDILYDTDSKVVNWMIVEPPSIASMITASVNEASDVAASDATFNIDNVTIAFPPGSAYPGGEAPTVCNNTLRIPAEDDAGVVAFYNHATDKWEGFPQAYTTECP